MRSCPSCGESERIHLPTYSKDNWLIDRCINCDMVYLSNPPPQSTLFDEYAWEDTSKQERARRRQNRRLYYFFSDGVKKFVVFYVLFLNTKKKSATFLNMLVVIIFLILVLLTVKYQTCCQPHTSPMELNLRLHYKIFAIRNMRRKVAFVLKMQLLRGQQISQRHLTLS